MDILGVDQCLICVRKQSISSFTEQYRRNMGALLSLLKGRAEAKPIDIPIDFNGIW